MNFAAALSRGPTVPRGRPGGSRLEVKADEEERLTRATWDAWTGAATSHDDGENDGFIRA